MSNLTQIIECSQIGYTPSLMNNLNKEHDKFKEKMMDKGKRRFFMKISDFSQDPLLSKQENYEKWRRQEKRSPMCFAMRPIHFKDSYIISVMHCFLNNKSLCSKIIECYNKAEDCIDVKEYVAFFDFARLIKLNYIATESKIPANLQTQASKFCRSLHTYFQDEIFVLGSTCDAFTFYKTFLKYLDQCHSEIHYIINKTGLINVQGATVQNNIQRRFTIKCSNNYKCKKGHLNSVLDEDERFLNIETSGDLHMSLQEFFRPANYKAKDFNCVQCKDFVQTTRNKLIEFLRQNVILKAKIFDIKVIKRLVIKDKIKLN